jgi:hypothetical protein
MIPTDGYAEWRVEHRRRRTRNELAVAKGMPIEEGLRVK